MESLNFNIKKQSSFLYVFTTILPVALLLIPSPFLFTHNHHSLPTIPPQFIAAKGQNSCSAPSPSPSPNPFVVKTCANTLYPSLCTHTLSNFPHNLNHDNRTRLRHALQHTIHKAITRVTKSQTIITASLNLDVQENMWINNCVELLHLTTYELQESMKHLQRDPPSYDTMKSLLSAAMTNKKTCIQNFYYLKLDYYEHTSISRYMQKSLTPIMRMICNGLGIINYLEYEGLRGYSCPVLDDRF